MAALVADIRHQTKILVKEAEYKTQSRMLAYEQIGQSIGASGMWVRGFIKGYDRYSLSYVVAMNIKSLYNRTCAHIEAGNEKMRQAENAAYQSSSGMPQASDSASLLPPNDYRE